MSAPELSALDPRLAPLLTEYPPDLFSARFHRSCELVDCYATDCARAVARELGLEAALARPATPAEALERAGCAPGFGPAMRWLLARLADDGAVLREGDRFHCAAPLAPAGVAELRQHALDNDPANAATLALFDAATAAYPPVAHGTASGEELLFGLGQVGLWVDYFSAGNPVYAVNNRLAAYAAAAVLARLDDRARSPLRILEVGAGAGSGSLAVLAELEQRGLLPRIGEYAVSEPSAFFRRRAERALRSRFAGAPLRFLALDIDQDWAAQGAPEASFDLVLGINVFHVARRLVPALTRARQTLAPDGALVLAECLRLWPGQPVANEFPFLLLDGFTRVEIDPEERPEPGFLEPDVWRRALRRAGLPQVTISPDVERIRDIYPRFNTGAVTARAG